MRGILVNLGDQRAVRPLGYGCARDDWDLCQGRDLGEGRGVGPQYRHLHVLDGLEQAALMIDQKQHGIAGIDDRFLPVEIGNVVHGVHDDSPPAHAEESDSSDSAERQWAPHRVATRDLM